MKLLELEKKEHIQYNIKEREVKRIAFSFPQDYINMQLRTNLKNSAAPYHVHEHPPPSLASFAYT